MARWVDLLDPDVAAVRDALRRHSEDITLGRLAAPPTERVRPSVIDLGDVVVVATLMVPVFVRDADALYLQEVEVVASPDVVVTIRKTPPGWRVRPRGYTETLGDEPAALDVVYAIADAVAEGFLTMLDDLDDEIEELEDGIDEWPARQIRTRIAELRRDVLTIRRTLARPATRYGRSSTGA